MKIIFTIAFLFALNFNSLFASYNPELGRWLNRDPIAENGGVNVYTFVFNSPMQWYDDLGTAPKTATKTIQVKVYADDSVKKISQKTRDKVNAQVDRLKKALSACCKKFKIGCDTKVASSYDNKNVPGGDDYDPYTEQGQKNANNAMNESAKSRKDNEINVILTNYSMGKNVGGIGNPNGIIIPMRNLDKTTILPHETGHFTGYDKGDIDKGDHSSDTKNIMHDSIDRNDPSGESQKQPDECYCKKLSGKAK